MEKQYTIYFVRVNRLLGIGNFIFKWFGLLPVNNGQLQIFSSFEPKFSNKIVTNRQMILPLHFAAHRRRPKLDVDALITYEREREKEREKERERERERDRERQKMLCSVRL
jgi:hypothetical protein